MTCLGLWGCRHTVMLVFLAPESSCDGWGGEVSLQTGERTAAGWGEPEPEQLEDTKMFLKIKDQRSFSSYVHIIYLQYFKDKLTSAQSCLCSSSDDDYQINTGEETGVK